MSNYLRSILFVILAAVVLAIPSAPCRECGALHAQEPASPPAVGTVSAPVSVDGAVASGVVVGNAGIASVSSETKPVSPTGPLPKLIDLGANKCKACKDMVPVLDEAKKRYAGVAEVEFIDVWENKDAGTKYGIRSIPTQIFFDKDGKEVFRHEGFLPLEEIQKQFESLGVK